MRNPVADIKAMAEYVAATSGLSATRIFVSAETKQALEHWAIWYEVTLERLHTTPRRRFITRLVLKRQLYGSIWRRSRLRRRMDRVRSWWRFRGEIDY